MGYRLTVNNPPGMDGYISDEYIADAERLVYRLYGPTPSERVRDIESTQRAYLYRDAQRAPCFECAIRTSCAEPCGDFRRYCGGPINPGGWKVKPKQTHQIDCHHCGTRFESGQYNARYCRSVCRSRAEVMRQRAAGKRP